MLTVALHFETGYLALVPLVVWPFVVPSDLKRRLLPRRRHRRGGAGRLGLGRLPGAGPITLGGAQPDPRGAGLENGYGTVVLWWLISGQLYDFGHRRRYPWSRSSSAWA